MKDFNRKTTASLLVIGILLSTFVGWFVGTKSVHIDAYLYPPNNHPFLEISEGEYVQIAERVEIEYHIGSPFTKDKTQTHFMLFIKSFDFENGGAFYFPSGTYYINSTITLHEDERK